MLECGFDIGKLFPIVSPHQKHAGLNAARFTHGDRRLNLLHGDSPLHRIQDFLGTTLRTDPNPEASQLREEIYRFGVQTVCPRNAFERNV